MGKYSAGPCLEMITKVTASPPPHRLEGKTSMSVVVTGATGHLGRLVVESLIKRGVPTGEIVATGRNLDKIKDLADQASGRPRPTSTTRRA